MNFFDLIAKSFPYLAPTLVDAIIKMAQAPAMSKEEILTNAIGLDDQTIELVKVSLGE